MNYVILLEASGTLVSGFMIKAVKNAGATAVASDIAECAAQYLADQFVVMPKHSHPDVWTATDAIIERAGINVVIPSLDETLLEWSRRKDQLRTRGVHVIISEPGVIEICRDKWKTFEFFKAHGVPTPETSLAADFPLIKPRCGRGGQGVHLSAGSGEKMEGMISQELLSGDEFTIDVFCDAQSVPRYIVPRKRIQVRDGKSTGGVTVQHDQMTAWVEKICQALKFIGPINMQCFQTPQGEIKFTEINPRIAGGMALGFAASENWVRLILQNLVEGRPFATGPIQYGLRMFRTYDEVFVS